MKGLKKVSNISQKTRFDLLPWRRLPIYYSFETGVSVNPDEGFLLFYLLQPTNEKELEATVNKYLSL